MKKFLPVVWELVKFAAITLLIVLPIRAYVAQPFVVNGVSMTPSFADGQYLIVDELSYHFRTPERGEVVVLRYPRNPDTFFIKRIIALPGETLTIKDNQILVRNDNSEKVLLEKYITEQSLTNFETTLGANEYFVMGDNRDQSYDSRYWGTVPEKFIKGRAWLRLFPFNQIDFLPADARGL